MGRYSFLPNGRVRLLPVFKSENGRGHIDPKIHCPRCKRRLSPDDVKSNQSYCAECRTNLALQHEMLNHG